MSGQNYVSAAAEREGAEGLDPWTALMRVLVAQLRGKTIPAELQSALAEADRHWNQHTNDPLAAKASVWQYIEAAHPSLSEPMRPAVRSARALLCVLEPGGDDETRTETAEWLADPVDDRR